MKRVRVEPGIKLKGVRRVVTGRCKVGTRVLFDHGDRQCVSERIIVLRARKAGYQAFRLPPGLWRALAQVEKLRAELPAAPLATLLTRVRDDGFASLRAPLVEALWGGLPTRRLRALLDRHTDGTVDPKKPGVPDLLVFKRGPDRRPFALRFVEVKRPNEVLKPHQLDEIRFMRSIGLKAGVLRLREGRVTRPSEPS